MIKNLLFFAQITVFNSINVCGLKKILLLVGFSLYAACVAYAQITPTSLTFPAGDLISPVQFSADAPANNWLPASRSLPTALVLNRETGILSGIPSALGTHSVKISSRRTSSSSTVRTTVNITITPNAPVVSSPAALPEATVGIPYGPVSLSASGGKSPYTWSQRVTPPSDAYAYSLQIDSATGAIFGNFATPGNYTIRIKVAGDNDIPQSTYRIYTLVVRPNRPSIVSPTLLLPGSAGVPYGPLAIQTSGGVEPYHSWNATVIRSPQGAANRIVAMSSTTGATANLTGSFTTPGNYTIRVAVSDSLRDGNGTLRPQKVIRDYPLIINATSESRPPRIVAPNTRHLPIATASLPYGPITIEAMDGTLPYTSWNITVTPPRGLPAPAVSISSNGNRSAELRGEFCKPGEYSLTIAARDGKNPPESGRKTYLLVVNPAPRPIIAPPSSILSNGTIDSSYGPVALSASGGTPPYSWNATVSRRPSGSSANVTISSSGTNNSTALFSGNFSSVGAYIVKVTVNDSNSCGPQSASADYSVSIDARSRPVISLPISGRLPDARVGVEYNQPITVSLGVPSYTFELSTGTLPPDIFLSPLFPITTPGNAAIAGVPTTAGDYDFRLRATDSTGTPSGNKGFWLKVLPNPVIVTPATLGVAILGRPYSTHTFNATGGRPIYSNWTSNPPLVGSGLTLDSSTGRLDGIPQEVSGTTYPSIVPIRVSVQDSISQTGVGSFSLLVVRPLAISGPTFVSGFQGAPVPAGTAYSATGGRTPRAFTWNATSGNQNVTTLTGLTLNSSSGNVTGNLTGQPGTHFVQARVADNSMQNATMTTEIRIFQRPTLNILTPSNLGTVDTTVTNSLRLRANPRIPAVGGNYTWSRLGNFTVTPASASRNVTITVSPSGQLTYRSTFKCSANFTVQVRDVIGTNATKNFNVSFRNPNDLYITTRGLPWGFVGYHYSATLSTKNGKEPIKWSVVQGSLGPEFELVPDATGRNAVLRWKSAQPPSQPISKNFTLRVEDSSPVKQVDECSYSLNIITIPPPPPPSPRPKLFDRLGSVLPVGKILAVEDWNTDGLNDVLLRQTNPETKEDQTSLYTNRGGFVFQNDEALPVECRSAVHVIVEDFDNDSFPDILAVDAQLRATLALNSGDGRFLPSELPGLFSGDLSGIDPENDLSCADIDADGDLDLLAAVRNPSGGNIVALFNRADDEGTFPSLFSGKSYLVKSSTPYPKFSIVSLDENPKPDLLVLQGTENSARNVPALLYLNTGTSSAIYTNSNNATSCAGFTTANATGIFGSVDGSFASMDIDNDGDIDLVAPASLSEGTATLDAPRIFLNQGNATFIPHSAPTLDAALQHRAPAAFDADLDGAIDLVWMDVSGVGPFYPRLWKNTWASNAAFSDITTNSDSGLSASPASEVEMVSTGFTADLDGDGDPDMLHTAVSREGTQESDPGFFAIYRNNSESRGETWLNTQLIGLFSPSRGTAARMVIQRDADVVDGNGTVVTSKPKFAQIIGPDTGNKAKNNLIFGLGRKGSADRVTVSWPSGLTINLANVETNPFRHWPYYRVLRIPETDALPPQRPIRQGRVIPWGAAPAGSQNAFTANLTDSVAISAGGSHSLTLAANGTVKAWGSNSSGQTAVPANLTGIVLISAGGSHNLALRSNGRLVAWGANDFGQATVPPSLRFAKTAAAGSNFSLAVNALGQVVGWGDNSSGQLTPPENLASVNAVAGGQSHALALTANGTLAAWGSNSSGQLAVPSMNGTRFTQIATGANHSLALTANGTVIAWGANNAGQSTVPPEALQNISQISASGDQSIALRSDGAIIAWGAGYQNSHLKPVSSNVVSISAGPGHALALRAVSTVYEDPNMVHVKGGFFPNDLDAYLFSGERVNDFRISKYEVTRRDWLNVSRWGIYNGYRYFTEGAGGQGYFNHPAYDLSWFDAIAWCNAMSEMNGLVPAYRLNGAVFKGAGATDPSQIESLPNATGLRLPTEEQWEWAARGGNRSQNFDYSGSNTLEEVAIYESNSVNADPRLESGGTRGAFPVGTKLPNELGLFDMSGNVWEHSFTIGVDPDLEPVGNATTNSTISRGGSWINSEVSCGFSDLSQNFQTAGYTSDTIGIRLSLNAEPEIIIPGNALEPQPTGAQISYQFTVIDPNSAQTPWNAYRWTVEGNLPPGIAHSGFLNGQSLVLSGTPTKAGWYDIILQVETDGYLVRKPVTLKFTPTGNETEEMILVEGGTLPENSELAGQQVATFLIGKYEVTWDEWQTVRTWAVANGYTDLAGVGAGSAGDHPVRDVSWYDVVKWINAKSEMEGLIPVYSVNGSTYKTGETSPTAEATANGFRLPAEAEWEWAARGGIASLGYTFSGSNDVNEVAWYSNNSGGGTKAVGTKLANELEIHDMSGNVFEWCWDLWIPQYINRRVRGGSWNSSNESHCAVGNRDFAGYENPRVDFIGFRLARNAGGEMITVQGGTLPGSSELAGQQVSTFQIGKYEVTWGEWKTVRDWAVANGYSDLAGLGDTYPSGSADNFPVINVGWYDVVKWSNARSEKEGLVPVYQVSGAIYKTGESVPTVNRSASGYRLPSEAEWEWVARGGVSSQGFTYSGSNDVNAVAWYYDNSSDGTKAVGTKAANELGIHDMSGNVWEWCEDVVYSWSARRVRGGSWSNDADYSTVSIRGYNDPGRYDNAGFRLARSSGN